MKILYDSQIFDYQNFGGISRYFYELIADFEKDNDVTWELPIVYSNNQYIKKLPRFSNNIINRVEKSDSLRKFAWGLQFRGKERLYHLKSRVSENTPELQIATNRNKAIEKLKEGNFDVFHPTYYEDYFMDYIGNKPYVLTVHDLIHQIFPELGLYDPKDKSRRMLDNASKIIAVSKSTKSDLVNIFDIEESKIEVIYHGNSLQQTGMVVSEEFRNKLPLTYFLYIGNRNSYKNFLFFVEVFAAATKYSPDINVVCTGPAFDNYELYLFNKIGITKRVFNIYVNDDELTYLYNNALSFIFPSMYEGFGIPILEAFSCGCPVLVSNSSSLVEIGEEAVVYFEPKNAASMRTAIEWVISNPTLRDEKVRLGYEQVKKFSWKKAALETKQVYNQVISL